MGLGDSIAPLFHTSNFRRTTLLPLLWSSCERNGENGITLWVPYWYLLMRIISLEFSFLISKIRTLDILNTSSCLTFYESLVFFQPYFNKVTFIRYFSCFRHHTRLWEWIKPKTWFLSWRSFIEDITSTEDSNKIYYICRMNGEKKGIGERELILPGIVGVVCQQS